jgi:carbon-monoxide dehydrogenase large subunit
MRVPLGQVRVLTERVGGSFGMKSSPFPEYACVLHAARLLGRPVKWMNDRSASFLSDAQGRDHEVEAELALDAHGHFLAARLSAEANLGAYLTPFGPHMAPNNFVRNFPSNYRTPLIEVSSRGYVTNTAPIAPYRGAGRPEANYFMERLVEAAAIETGIDAAELRRLEPARRADRGTELGEGPQPREDRHRGVDRSPQGYDAVEKVAVCRLVLVAGLFELFRHRNDVRDCWRSFTTDRCPLKCL